MVKVLGGQWRLEVFDPVSIHVLARQDAGTVAATDCSGDKGIVEQRPALGETIQMGSLDVVIARDPQTILRLVIGEHEQNVGRPLLGLQPRCVQQAYGDKREDPKTTLIDDSHFAGLICRFLDHKLEAYPTNPS